PGTYIKNECVAIPQLYEEARCTLTYTQWRRPSGTTCCDSHLVIRKGFSARNVVLRVVFDLDAWIGDDRGLCYRNTAKSQWEAILRRSRLSGESIVFRIAGIHY
ncbi:MAG: hypothetical protein OEU52_17005, partial [Xanthomonadales bacterium]|nr:hypothetical protein [Xanthomonadales bacterium]